MGQVYALPVAFEFELNGGWTERWERQRRGCPRGMSETDQLQLAVSHGAMQELGFPLGIYFSSAFESDPFLCTTCGVGCTWRMRLV